MLYELLQMDARKIGREEGIEIGEARGRVNTFIQLVKEGLLDIKEACKRTSMTEQEFQALLK